VLQVQVDNLYTTATSISVGETTNQYRDEYTSTISQIYSSDGSVSQEAYWLGWISYDNLPIYCQHNTVNEDENSITFVNDTVAQNYPIGYVYNGGSENYNHVYMQNDEPLVTPANTCRFINNLHPEYSAHMVSTNFGNITIGYNIAIDGIYIVGGFVYGTDTGGLTGLLSWLNGETTRTLSFTYNGNTYTIDVDLSQMTDTYFLEIPTNEDSEIIVTFSLIQILFSGNTRYKNGTSYGNTFISPSTRILHDNGDETGNYNCFIGSWGNTAMSGFAAYYSSVGSVQYRDDYVSPKSYETRTGCSGTFSKTELLALPNKGVLYSNNIMAYHEVRSSSRSVTFFIALLSPKDIITAISLFYRVYYNAENISANPTLSSYVENISWATDVNESNEFLGVLKTGNITNSEFRNGLRTWQYTNIQYNDFTEDDIPEYNPEPGGDEDEESGTRIPNQFRYFTRANNFISQYAMKASQIQTFGQMLWNSWAESTTFVDAVNNFWIALNIENFTGSFDISSVMNFIVSLKVFPFNITHFETSIFTLTDTLRIGRGTFPFLFPSEVGNIIKVLSNIVYVDCGLIHDPTTGQYGIPRKFNDFRDYTNVSITCFCPYCGTVELNPGDVVGRQLSCKYAVDLQTGECLCLITVADSTGDLYNVAAISGNMGANIPVSATNSGLIEARRLSDAGNALGLFGGMFTENMSMGSNTFARAKDSQSSIGAIASATTQAAGNLFKDIKQTSNFAANMLSRSAIGCPIMQGGSGFAAFSQADTPYVQIRYGIYSEPANYQHSVGRISTKSDVLSSYKDSGLVICENVDVSGFTCHEDERAEIKALLESGVYL
jgi:hypothetical protein